MSSIARAVDTSAVPGVVIDYQSLSYVFYSSVPAKYISDPEILVLSPNTYLASHAYGGRNYSEGQDGLSKVFLTTDGGATWTQQGSDISGLLRASLYQDASWIYLMGAHDTQANENARVLRSNNNGSSWELLTLNITGFGTPNNPVEYNGRLWSGSGINNINAPLSDLWTASSWKLQGTGAITGASEGQVVAAPGKGIFVLPKIRDEVKHALIRVDPSSGKENFDSERDFIDFPGGEKKFGASYDAVSGRFYALSNPILPEDEDLVSTSDSDRYRNMLRNTAALLSSDDLYNWDIEKVFLHVSDPDSKGFGYLNFDYDGDDMVIVGRGAWPISGETSPRRGHDSNCFSFYRIDDFRSATPDQFLTISGNQILRYERTPDSKDEHAELGDFCPGTSLSSPDGIGQDTGTGYVYVRESGGDIHCFDALGNFLETVASSPVAFLSQIDVIQPPDGATSWIAPGSGDWYDLNNWHYLDRADNTRDVAVFGSASASAATVNLADPHSRVWNFNTDGDQEGWTTTNMTGVSVALGTFQASASTADPYMTQSGQQSFYGDDVPTVTVRMKAATSQTTVQLYWRTTVNRVFSSARLVNTSYTGNGEFQDVVFNLAGHAEWDGQLIYGIRIDPASGGYTGSFEIDSITVQKMPTKIKGLRFHNSHSYTVNGEGSLQIEAASGNGLLQAQEGSHEVQVPVTLACDTDFTAPSGATLDLSGGLSLGGYLLTASTAPNASDTTIGQLSVSSLASPSGDGLVVSGPLDLDGGTLEIGSETTVTFGSAADDTSGTIRFTAPANFSPEEGDVHQFIIGAANLSAAFTAVELPDLPDGLGWDSADLYTGGTATIILRVPPEFMDAHGLPNDGSADFVDSDGDGQDNYSEWKAGTIPTDASSYFTVSDRRFPDATGHFRLQWQGIADRIYNVERSSDLTAEPPFQTLATDIPGVEGTMEYTDTDAPNHTSLFYKVSIE